MANCPASGLIFLGIGVLPDRDPANPTFMFTWDSVKELLTPTNSSSRLVLSSAHFSRDLHSKKYRKRFCGHLEILTIIEELKAPVFMMMKTTIANMKLCGHPVSHTHTHTVLHSLSIIVNLQDFQLSSPVLTVSFTLYVSLKVPNSYWQIFS